MVPLIATENPKLPPDSAFGLVNVAGKSGGSVLLELDAETPDETKATVGVSGTKRKIDKITMVIVAKPAVGVFLAKEEFCFKGMFFRLWG